MKEFIFFTIISIILASCNSKNNKSQNNIKSNKTEIIPTIQKSIKTVEVDTNKTLQFDFKKFRDAVYQGKKKL